MRGSQETVQEQLRQIFSRKPEAEVKIIAQKVGVSQTTIYRWLKGEGLGEKKKFIEFLTCVGIDPNELIRGEE